jgi:predicted PurR-regulated permease PerM
MEEQTQDDENVAPSDAAHEHLRVASRAHGAPLTILAVVAGTFALQAARNFVVPLLVAILIAYTLYPAMSGLRQLRIPRFIGATLLTTALVCGVLGAAISLRDEFGEIAERLPVATHKLARLLGKLGGDSPVASLAPIRRMQEAASELEKATSQAVGGAAPRPAPQQVFNLHEWLLAGSVGIVGLASQAVVMLFLVFFLLLSGDTFKRKLIKLVGSSMWRKKTVLHLLEDINTSIQRYMTMLVVTNSVLALSMWVALRWIGLENAGAWAIFAGLLHIIPYFGPLFITVATGLIAYLQFESLSTMFAAAAVSLAIATFIGMFMQTWMAGRIARMNAAAVFIGLLFWGWLWGTWGLLLGIPIIVILKVIAERVEGLQPIAELLSE